MIELRGKNRIKESQVYLEAQQLYGINITEDEFRIIDYFCKEFDVSFSKLRNLQKYTRDLVEPRQFIAYFLNKKENVRYHRIAYILNYATHAGALNSVERISELLEIGDLQTTAIYEKSISGLCKFKM